MNKHEVKGRFRMFISDRGQYPSYSVGVSGKTKDGEWINKYLPIGFKKEIDITQFKNGEDIEIEGFLSANANGVKLMAMTAKKVDEEVESSEDSFAQLEEDIPF